MHQAPASEANDLLPFKRSISLPYRLTPGKSTGTFLAELAGRRIMGTRCTRCGRVEVPAQDVCRCGHDGLERVQVGEHGTLQGFTQTPEYTLSLVRLEGADVDLMHRLVGDPPSGSGWEVGMRIAAVWAETAGAQGLARRHLALRTDRPASRRLINRVRRQVPDG